MKRIANAIAGTIGVLTMVVILVLFAIAAIDYLTDPRPASNSDMCRIKQEAIFKRPINRTESPAEYVKEVRDACK